MKLFVDTADVDEIRKLAKTGLIDGVTTNPSLVSKAGRDFKELVAEICELVDGPISAEVTALDSTTIIEEGEKLAKIAENVCIKVPLTIDGLIACRELRERGYMVNVTLCFSAAQAILAAKANATFVSPFIGRLDDTSTNGMALIDEISHIYRNYHNFQTEVLVASIRTPLHVVESARRGAGAATIPPKIIYQMIEHPLTIKGLASFLEDWKSTGQQI